MKIQFVVDFRGRETAERFYKAGEVADFEPTTAARLIADKRAVLVAEEQPAEVTPPAKKGKVKK